MMKVKEEFKRLIPPLTNEEFSQLEKNCIAEGIRESIILWNGFIIDGHNRYEIATKNNLSFETITKEFDSEDDVRAWMIDNQLGKRNLTELQKSALRGKKLNERKKQVGGQSGNVNAKNDADKLSQSFRTSQQVAKEENVSSRTIERDANFATGLSHTTPELEAKILNKEVKVNKSDVQEIAKAEPTFVATSEKEILEKAKEIRTAKAQAKKEKFKDDIKQQTEAIEKRELPELEGKFNVLSFDPPWPYEGESKKVTTYDPNGRRVANPYPEMSIEQIKSIDVPALDDSVCFLWTTHKFLPDAFDILKEWGFDYKATLVWNKEKIGMGAWFRMQCEFCLVGIKGKPYFENTKYRDILTASRREHSRKPDEFFDMVTEITEGRRLEYFSREQREGWSVFGNDTNKF